eukprot:scaffold80161_cov45-Phaeocystis_antarctica.AAC.1
MTKALPAGAPPTIRSAAGGPGGRWGSVVLGWRALRPPRVVGKTRSFASRTRLMRGCRRQGMPRQKPGSHLKKKVARRPRSARRAVGDGQVCGQERPVHEA